MADIDYSDLRAKAEKAAQCRPGVGSEGYGPELAIFHGTASPSVVISLLAEREADKARIAELEGEVGRYVQVDDLRVGPCMWREVVARAERAEAELEEARAALVNAYKCLESGDVQSALGHIASARRPHQESTP